MMNKMLALASAAFVSVAAVPANAATTLTLTPVLGVPTAAFGNLNPSGTNTDTYTFTLPSAGTVIGGVASFGLRILATNLDFTTVKLNGVDFDILSTGASEIRTITTSVVAGPQTLTVGYKNAQRFSSYAGAVAFFASPTAPVPEPATWAMMILGLGAVGGAMRYRRRETAVRFA